MKRSATKNLLLIFAKAPEPGKVKTRLTPAISEKAAARLHQAFLSDILSATRPLQTRRVLACWPTTEDPFFEALKKKESLQTITQKGRDLGEKMLNAFSWGFSEGFEKIVLIGSDAPSLPAEIIRSAFDILDNTALVLGPSCDGGYYLIGGKKAMPELFRQLPWGTEKILEKTLVRAEQAGHHCQLLPFWYDVDRPGDLALLAAHLRVMEEQGQPLPLETMAILQQIREGLLK